jgi:hypothetical protein
MISTKFDFYTTSDAKKFQAVAEFLSPTEAGLEPRMIWKPLAKANGNQNPKSKFQIQKLGSKF